MHIHSVHFSRIEMVHICEREREKDIGVDFYAGFSTFFCLLGVKKKQEHFFTQKESAWKIHVLYHRILSDWIIAKNYLVKSRKL